MNDYRIMSAILKIARKTIVGIVRDGTADISIKDRKAYVTWHTKAGPITFQVPLAAVRDCIQGTLELEKKSIKTEEKGKIDTSYSNASGLCLNAM